MEGEFQAIQRILKVLVFRILEATSLRELMSPEKFKEMKKELPQLLDLMCSNYNLNKDKFEHLTTDPLDIRKLQPLHNHLEQCSTPELVNLAEVAIFIMEKEVFKINSAIIEAQN
ncbi:hypothetical protein BST79_gp214 [Only Syngen Nebraska virus 5]|uniref:hypothetical protein n=1 Tax=Only Syngen Nebraska virus 5 TaxID=1917232 RepID=UPI00090115EC|nr:hypothetical protein BST79_gp214 [Only Syngen Nebraska virus 5]APC25727.1 hypothetical protein [Only Syngen Nebraska virus 5]